jgi:hypothetical protein
MAAHYIWTGPIHFFWTQRNRTFFLFARYDDLIYMPLPPLGELSPEAVHAAVDFMEKTNRNPRASRIENVDETQLPFFKSLGYSATPGFPEYLYRREDLAGLQGDRYKSQRAACNHFEKHHRGHPVEPYRPSDQEACLALFDRWSRERHWKNTDSYYRALLEDSRRAHRIALRHFKALGLTGRVIRIGTKIRAYSFGFPCGRETFCVLLEISDLRYKGLAPSLFREFCREVAGYASINTLDDSGLENLRRVKRSYHPWKMAIPYTITPLTSPGERGDTSHILKK